MSGLCVFVSYSHKDRDLLEILRPCLKPIEKGGHLELCSDEKIDHGEVWRRRISAAIDAADLAILIVTEHFIASDFITDEEMPRLLARQQGDDLTLLPVFFRPSLANKQPYTFEIDGQPVTAKLGDFQGCGRPDRTLFEMPVADRMRRLNSLAESLLERAHPARTSSPTAPQRGRRSNAPAESPIQLTVQLNLAGDEVWLTYQVRGSQKTEPHIIPWTEHRESFLSVNELLNTGNRTALARWVRQTPEDLGQRLFDLLFGDSFRWGPVFRDLYDRHLPAAQPTPLMQGTRLHIVTDDPVLLTLPWRLLAYERHFLASHGWIISVGSAASPEAMISTEFRHTALMLTPSTDASHSHLRAMTSVVQEAWGGLEDNAVHVVHDAAAFKDAMSRFSPHLVYIRTSGYCRHGDAGLVLDDEPLSLHDLAEIVTGAPSPPSALYLNVNDLIDEHHLAQPAAALGHLPFVAWRRLPERHRDADDEALLWLSRWLRQGHNPLQALHRKPERLTPESATLCAAVNFRQWTVDTLRTEGRGRLARLLLDRVDVKGRVLMEVSKLMDSPSRSVLALVGTGGPGLGAASLGDQLKESLERALMDRAQLRWKNNLQLYPTDLDIPPDLAWAEHLESSLESQMGKPLGEHPEQFLTLLAPPPIDPKKRKLLCLDWGTLDQSQGAHRQRLIEGWLDFCRQYLAVHGPKRVLIVSLLTLEVPDEEYPGHQQFLSQLHRQRRSRDRSFRWVALPALGHVPDDELWDFIEEQTSCPKELHGEATELILETTSGLFEDIVHWIEEAETTSWEHLLERLRAPQTET